MTLADRLTDAHTRAMRAYLDRQRLEGQRQQLALAIQQCEQVMLQTDGEIALVESLIAEASGGE